jgi:hypothetical protein
LKNWQKVYLRYGEHRVQREISFISKLSNLPIPGPGSMGCVALFFPSAGSTPAGAIDHSGNLPATLARLL